MKKLKSDDNILGRFSELPDSLVLEILSLMDIRDVVRTTILSKRWKDFWVTIPCLEFIYLMRDLNEFRSFVNGTLARWRGTRLRKFFVFFVSDSETESESGASLAMDVGLWVQFAAERKVEDLCIVFYCQDSLCCPPQCLYECSSITKLSLSGCNLQSCGNVKWDCLNTLKLDRCVFSEDVMNQVLSSSSQLQDFTICFHQRFELQGLSIRSSSLKKLSIEFLKDIPYVLTIWAPNLQVLKYWGTSHVKCLLTDISSLIEVHLHFSRDGAVKEALFQILPLIQHVVSVQLSTSCIEVFRDINKGNCSFSPLLNVKLLTIDSCWIEHSNKDFIVGLLECFPKLKMLIINWDSDWELLQYATQNNTESEENIQMSNLLQLRTVVITSFFEFTGFLLKHATMIEKMVIRRKGVLISEVMFEAPKKLMSLQRSFPKVELVLC